MYTEPNVRCKMVVEYYEALLIHPYNAPEPFRLQESILLFSIYLNFKNTLNNYAQLYILNVIINKLRMTMDSYRLLLSYFVYNSLTTFKIFTYCNYSDFISHFISPIFC